jgi:hypothetical protein
MRGGKVCLPLPHFPHPIFLLPKIFSAGEKERKLSRRGSNVWCAPPFPQYPTHSLKKEEEKEGSTKIRSSLATKLFAQARGNCIFTLYLYSKLPIFTCALNSTYVCHPSPFTFPSFILYFNHYSTPPHSNCLSGDARFSYYNIYPWIFCSPCSRITMGFQRLQLYQRQIYLLLSFSPNSLFFVCFVFLFF